MHLNLGSLCFNMNLEQKGGTPAWGTELGQGDGYRFNFEGMEEFLPSMLYSSIEDFDNVYCPLGKGGDNRGSYQYIVASKYSKIYVNNAYVKDASFLLLIIRLISGEHHVGRMTLKYNPKMSYRGEELNQNCFTQMRDTLGLNEDSAWFVSEIFTKNQDELHFVAHIVDKENPQTYRDINTRKNIFKQFLIENEGKKVLFSSENESSLQTIFFGTPGSGKSHRVKELTEGKRVHRTTFYPDSDYASFVGCYKPTMSPSKFDVDELLERLAKEDTTVEQLFNYRKNSHQFKDIVLRAECNSSDISYTFTPQVFTEAYIDAWTHLEEEVYLVIEEINRGNCAQIFGDLFQLLDRKVDGSSDYRIKADSDLRSYLTEKLGENHEGIQNGELCLPPNLHILATMNTSDQSLFPMDSAFKRRWDWEYVPVDYSESVPSSRFIITLGDKQYRWVDFLREVNERIRKATDSEDKQMGNFFIKANVSEEQFKSKVMFYLWNEVCRDEYGTPNNFFRISQDSEFSFNDLYQTDGLEKLQGFMAYLGVASTTEETDQAIEEPTEA